MPDVLVACGLVVLPGRDAIAAVTVLHGERNETRSGLDVDGKLGRKVIDVLEVVHGTDDDCTVVLRPPLRVNPCNYRFVAKDDLCLSRPTISTVHTRGYLAYRASVIVGRVVEHRTIVREKPAPEGWALAWWSR